MTDSILNAVSGSSHLILTVALWSRYYFPFLQMRNRGMEMLNDVPEVTELVKWYSWDQNPDSLRPEPMLLSTMLHFPPKRPTHSANNISYCLLSTFYESGSIPGVLNQGNFAPQGICGDVWEHFCASPLWWGVPWHWVCKGQGCC